MNVVLWHIPVSHYSEKVRWALDYKGVEHERRAPMPGGHVAVALWLTRGRQITFPVAQFDGETVGDSTAIIAALEQHVPEPPLYPADPEQRRQALELEEFFDEELGPHIRLYAFHELAQDRESFGRLAAAAAPGPLKRMPKAAGAYGRAWAGLRFRVHNDERAEVAREKVLAAIDRLEAELRDDDYLVGDEFTVADLTAAAIFYPLVLPPDGPVAEEFGRSLASFREPLMERRGMRWVREIFRRHRRRQGAPSAATVEAGAGI
jgi:glutathione S-transferase